jgi:hypothetical protein
VQGALDDLAKSFAFRSPMTGPSTLAASPADPAAAGAQDGRALLARQLAMLGELAEIGMDLARALARQATKPAPPETAPETASETASAAAAEDAHPVQVATGDVSLAYARLARAVRLTLAQQARRLQDVRALDEVAARQLNGGRGNAARDRKARIRRILDRVIDAEVADEAEGDRLAEEARERLEHDDIYGDVLARSVGEIVAMICRDLGLAPAWTDLAKEAWAQDEIAGGEAGSPFNRPPWPWLDAPAPDAPRTGPPRTGPPSFGPQAASP